MKLAVDYSRIFFDKYPLTAKEKESSAQFILENILSETVGEGNFSLNGAFLEISDCDFGNLLEFLKIAPVLKEEFFIIVTKWSIERINATKAQSNVEEFVRNNYQYDSLTAGYICEKLNIRRADGEKEILEKYNMTISDFIRKIRVEKACEMLELGFNSEKAAVLSGLGSVKTLQRSFKCVLGKTPGDYKLR